MAETKNWILLRGLARGRGHWGSFAKMIQEHFPNDKFEFIDLPGNGERHNEDSPTSVADFVTDLRARSQFVKEGKKFQILSVSLGSMITVEWMRQFPEEVEKAYLMCTSSSGFSAFYNRFLPPNYVRLIKLLSVKNDKAAFESGVLEMVANSHERRQAELPALIEYSTQNQLDPKNVIRQLTAASRYKFPHQPPGKIILIGSHGDRLVSPKCTLDIANAWGLTPHMHNWAGHDLTIDDPAWVLEQLL